MERLGLALLLALGCHVVLFLVILPEKQEYKPVLHGKQQVVVSIQHQAVFPVESPPDVRDEIELEPKVEPELESIKVPEKEREPIQEILTDLKPVARKIEVPDEHVLPEETLKLDTVVPVAMQRQRAVKAARVEPIQLPLGGGNPVVEKMEVTGEAVPLAEKNIPPEYPKLARRRGWEGTVMLEVDVMYDGQVRSVSIQTSSTHSLLDNVALAAVQKWRFAPGTKNGRPVAMKVLVPVHFVLKEQ